jgi:hypothetical protein
MFYFYIFACIIIFSLFLGEISFTSNEIEVRLMASVDDGSYLIPKVDSTVIVSYSDFVLPYVSMFSEIEKII